MFYKGNNHDVKKTKTQNPKPLQCELRLESSSDTAGRQTKQNPVARIILTLLADFPNMWSINTTLPKLIQEMLRQTLHLNEIKPENWRTNRKCFGNESSSSL